MKKLVALTASSLVAAGAVGIATTASAEAEGGHQGRCVTYREFAEVDAGMSKREVHRLFDSRGRRFSTSSFSGMESEVRTYRTCPGDRRFSDVTINYDDYSYGSDRRGGPMEVTSKDMMIMW